MDTGTIRATEDEALQFHSTGRPGKLSIAPTKPLTTQRDLSLAYSPGIAIACRTAGRQLTDKEVADVIGEAQAGRLCVTSRKRSATSPS